MMIRLLAVLSAFVFMSLWFLGEGHGQNIHPPRAAIAQAKPQVRAVFIPAPPIMQPTAPAVVEAAPPVVPAVQAVAAPVALRVMQVPGGASVRSGPGRAYPVVGNLPTVGVVMVTDDASAPGWVRIRVDGQGEGWVWGKLLRE